MPVSTSLYEHLTELFNRLSLHHQAEAWENFEQISGLVKRSQFVVNKTQNEQDVKNKIGVVTNAQALDFIN